MQSDVRSDMGTNKLEESFSIDLMERGRLGGIVRQVVVWGGDTSACGVGTGIPSYYLLSVTKSSY
jgi:hypothetical protein